MRVGAGQKVTWLYASEDVIFFIPDNRDCTGSGSKFELLSCPHGAEAGLLTETPLKSGPLGFHVMLKK